MAVEAQSPFYFESGEWKGALLRKHEVWCVCDICGKRTPTAESNSVKIATNMAMAFAKKKGWTLSTITIMCAKCGGPH